VSKFHPECLKLQKNLEVSYSQLKEEKYNDSTKIGKMSKLDFLIENMKLPNISEV
jgi:hypothetical protein